MLPLSNKKEISIHAPARGATSRFNSFGEFVEISIHAPARGATVTESLLDAEVSYISIHAPARGATTCQTLLRG